HRIHGHLPMAGMLRRAVVGRQRARLYDNGQASEQQRPSGAPADGAEGPEHAILAAIEWERACLSGSELDFGVAQDCRAPTGQATEANAPSQRCPAKIIWLRPRRKPPPRSWFNVPPLYPTYRSRPLNLYRPGETVRMAHGTGTGSAIASSR